jgi:hypothetical protein
LAAWLFNKYSHNREKEALSVKTKEIIKKEVEDNLAVIPSIRKMLDENKVGMLPTPFSTSSFQIILQGKFIEYLEPSYSQLIIDLHDGFISANEIYKQLREYSVGIQSALGGSDKIRPILIATIKKQLEVIEKKAGDLLSRA